MHIPDSAVSPATSLLAGAAMVPIWYAASRRLVAELSTRRVPLLAAGAAFCFTIMMFNLPVPGGTTVHAVGGVLLAVLLGPWAAVMGMTVTLAIQALFFADGGVLAIGANCLAMAFTMPMAGYAAYRLAAGRAPAGSRRRAAAAGIGAYVGVNAAALITAVLLGVQPALYHDAAGHALYFPLGLAVTVPAMLIAHLTVAGIGEAVLTTVAVRYLQKARVPLADPPADGAEAPRLGVEWLLAGLGALIALTPLGLLAKGPAWGEWSLEELLARVGYVPSGLVAAERHGIRGFDLLPGYLGDRGPLAYLLSGLLGALVVAALLYASGRLLARSRRVSRGRTPPGPGATGIPEAFPAWLRTGASAAGGRETRRPARLRSTLGGRDFVERSLADLSESARTALVSETWSRRDGLLQRLDPRAKVVALLGFVVLTAFLRNPWTLSALVLLVTALAALSRIPLGALHRRVWLSMPLAAGAVTLPAALSAVTPGRALVVLSRDPYLAITAPGLAQAGLLALRVGVALSFVVLLALTTPWNDLMRGLRVLGVPRPFLTVLAMTYRYLGVLSHAAYETFIARRSRTVGPARARDGRGFLGGAAGGLLGKTLALGEEVHAAMIARGFAGDARSLAALRFEAADAAWLATMALIAALAAFWGALG
ncbi:MAG: cobalt transporter CbiM [Acidobacteriia bacterium]|nr:cobalt transporter CbiM [Terriglobia bacterium]